MKPFFTLIGGLLAAAYVVGSLESAFEGGSWWRDALDLVGIYWS